MQAWVADEAECYKLAKVSAASDGAFPYDPDDANQSDLVQMANVDVANILNVLRVRHKAGAVYTSVGGICVSVNPYKFYNIYTPKIMREHYEAFGTKELAPHVYSLASDSYKALCVTGKSQTIVTSGESGAGKTENAKQVFRFLAEIAGVQAGGGDGERIGMHDLLIHSNPVLECFGNAKTLRNDNSSRFGKLTTVHFDGSGKIIGATNRNYLLEKPRVAAPPANERNYHAFYQLLAGAAPEELSPRRLDKSASKYKLLSATTTCAVVEGMDDAKEWRDTVGAMTSLGFAPDEIACVVDIVGALLHLGNVEIVAGDLPPGAQVAVARDTKLVSARTSNAGDEYAAIAGGLEALSTVSSLLGVDNGAFASALTQIQVRDTVNTLTVDKAKKNRDAVLASMYAKLFDCLVSRINGAGGELERLSESNRSISVLDIFGFEIFEMNSFEQLCINFANEKLQRNFTMTTFQAEEGLYTSEGIEFEHIPYIDNSPVLELLDLLQTTKGGPRGIMQILDEEVHLPRTTDQTFLDKINAAFGRAPGVKTGGHPNYSTDFKRPHLFCVSHYAGKVEYNPIGFLEKSVENVAVGLVKALKTSSKPLVADLFTMQSARRSIVPGSSESSRKPSVGLKFTKQLGKLITTIEETQAFFIRCIKPNKTKSSTSFDAPLTLEQLRYSGVFEAVAIRKSGYPFRLSHRQFAHRYSCVIPQADAAKLDFSEAGMRGTVQAMVSKHLPTAPELLAAAAKVAAAKLSEGEEAPPPLTTFGMSDVKVGKSMAFFRSRENRCLELAREAAIVPRLKYLCRLGRGLICRGAKRRLRAAKANLSAAVAAKELHGLEKAFEDALTPQRGFYKGEALPFSLHLPNRAEVAALLADLRQEERVEPALASLVEADNLSGETYNKLREELAIAAGLRERLGREVPHFAAAECVVGMTDGVNEHDHDRLVAALATAEGLGLSSKLSNAMDKARKEVAFLKDGLVLEQALKAELGVNMSVYKGNHVWDHSGIKMNSLQAALDAGEKHPLVSKQGKALMVEAKLALEVRPLLKMEDYQATLQFLEGLNNGGQAGGEKQTTEVRNAWSELTDQCELRLVALRSELAVGRSARIGEGKWDHKGIATIPVAEAKGAVEAFPYKTDAGKLLIELAGVVLSVRGAIKGADWKVPASWASLASVLEGVPSSQREAEEVQSGWSELTEMRTSLEAAVIKALDANRSTKKVGAGTIGWSHEEINTEGLAAAVAQLDEWPRQTDTTKSLSLRAKRAIQIRTALLTATWPTDMAARTGTASTWATVADTLDELGESPPPAAGVGGTIDEVMAAREEFDEARVHYESVIRNEMGKGRSSKAAMPLVWDHASLSSDELEQAILEALDLVHKVRPFPSTEQTMAEGQFVVEMRANLLNAEWGEKGDPASWAPICEFLDGVEPEYRDLEEVVSARQEVVDRRKVGEAELAKRLSGGRSVRTSAAAWSHEGVDAVGLKAALDAVRAFPKVSDEGAALGFKADAVLPIRAALRTVKIGSSATWGGVWAALEKVPTELRDEDEVSSGWEEILEARAATEAAVKSALSTKRSIKSPPIWSHAELSAGELTAAMGELEAFPKVSEEGKTLASQAKVVLAIRGALGTCDWAKAGSWGGLAAALDAVPPEHATLEEVAAARAEFADKREQTMAEVRDRMATGASIKGSGGAGWDHGGIKTAELDAAIDECAAFVRPAPEAAQLLVDAQLISALRKALIDAKVGASASWQALASFLAATQSGGHDELPEYKAAWLELREARDAATSKVTASLANGCSVQVAPAAAWDHSKLDAKALFAAVEELEAFPKIAAAPPAAPDVSDGQGGGGAPPMLRAQTMARRRASLERVTQVAVTLSSSARTIAKLRELLLAEDWASVLQMLTKLEGASEPLHELCAEEASKGRVELQDRLLSLEAAVKAQLETHRSRRPSSTSASGWDHSELSAKTLVDASESLKAFPLQSDTSATLLKIAAFVVQVRELLLTKSWGALCGLLEDIKDADVLQHEEVRQAGVEVEMMRVKVVKELEDAVTKGGSLKVIGKKVNVFVEKSYYLPITWDHSSLGSGVRRLQAAVESVGSFPGVREKEGVGAMLQLSTLILELRTLIVHSKWPELLKALDAIELPSHLVHDEVVMARQEYLTQELEAVTKSLDQKGLKAALAMATSAGMLPCEKPVYQALQVFIDPPEYVLNLPPPPTPGVPHEVGPSADGTLVLTVKVRGAKTLQWNKNGIALKEGADGGRITGVTTPILTLSRMLGRDDKQKLQCVAVNKFGTVKSHEIKIRLDKVGGAEVPEAEEEASEASTKPDDDDDDDDDDDKPRRRTSLTKGKAFGKSTHMMHEEL